MKCFLWLALVLGGCASSRHRPGTVEKPGLPQYVVAASNTILRLPEDPKVRLAFPRSELPLRVRETAKGLVADIDGAVRVSGIVKLNELGVVVCEPGLIDSHFYAGNANLLTLRSEVRDGRVRVAGVVTVPAKSYSTPHTKQFRQMRQMPFESELDAARLCTGPLPKRHAGTAEDPQIYYGVSSPDLEDFPAGTQMVEIEKDTPLQLLDAPGGNTVHSFPAEQWGFSLVRLRTEGAWDLVAAGGGPYLVGWIPTRSPKERGIGVGGLIGGRSGKWAEVPFALMDQKHRALPLYELPADTVVQQFGVPRARLKKSGYGRVVGVPQGSWSYVIAAVDEDVTVEGWVETAKLGRLLPPEE